MISPLTLLIHNYSSKIPSYTIHVTSNSRIIAWSRHGCHSTNILCVHSMSTNYIFVTFKPTIIALPITSSTQHHVSHPLFCSTTAYWVFFINLISHQCTLIQQHRENTHPILTSSKKRTTGIKRAYGSKLKRAHPS